MQSEQKVWPQGSASALVCDDMQIAQSGNDDSSVAAALPLKNILEGEEDEVDGWRISLLRRNFSTQTKFELSTLPPSLHFSQKE